MSVIWVRCLFLYHGVGLGVVRSSREGNARAYSSGASNKAMTPRFLCAYISIINLLLLES